MTRFVIIKQTIASHTLYKLLDTVTEANAIIVPELGNNCLQFHALCGEKICKIINDLSFIEGLTAKPSRYGIPILFPWASTIANGEYQFSGKQYKVVPHANAKDFHHGFVNRMPWSVTRFQEGESFVSLTCEIQSSSCARYRSGFPWEFRFEITYILDKNGLSCETVIENESTETMPLFLGFHPYFAIEEISAKTRSKVRLDLSSVLKEYQLKKILSDPPPTGNVTEQVDDKLKNPLGIPMKDTNFNNVYYTNARDKGKLTTGYINPDKGYKIQLEATSDFETLVVFNPQDRAAVSLEPWTATVDAFNLASRGIPDSGIKTIAPGKKWKGGFQITATPISYTNQ